jgi:hypothetical protein
MHIRPATIVPIFRRNGGKSSTLSQKARVALFIALFESITLAFLQFSRARPSADEWYYFKLSADKSTSF